MCGIEEFLIIFARQKNKVVQLKGGGHPKEVGLEKQKGV